MTDADAGDGFAALFDEVDLETPPGAYPTRDDVALELSTALGLLAVAESFDALDAKVVTYSPGVWGRLRNAAWALAGSERFVVTKRATLEATAPADLSETITDLEARVDELAAEYRGRTSPEERLAAVERGLETLSDTDDPTGLLDALAAEGRR